MLPGIPVIGCYAMEKYTEELLQDPATWLEALSVCLGGQWIEKGDWVGFTVTHDGFSTDVEFNSTNDTLTVTSQGFHVTRWTAPLATCVLTQRIDDGQLFTELASAPGKDSDASNSLSVWGPEAKYRGGPMEIQNPEIDDERFILNRIVEHL